MNSEVNSKATIHSKFNGGGSQNDNDGGCRRKKKCFIISLITGLILLSAGLIFLNRVFIRTDVTDQISGIYDETNDYDVLILGSSHSYCSFYPMQLWGRYGIAAYDRGSGYCSIQMSYFNAENTFKLRKPKVAVLEVYPCDRNHMQGSHNLMDTLPFSIRKYEFLRELYKDNKSAANELIFPLSIYHSRWTELTADMVKNGFGMRVPDEHYYVTKGAWIDFKSIFKPQETASVPKEEYDSEYLSDENAEYVRKFIDLCRENDVIPLVIEAPYNAGADEQRRMNAYLKTAADCGARTINFFDENVIDMDTDLNDRGHLNLAGAVKATDYMGRYLKESFGLSDKRKNPDYDDWNEYYLKYREKINERVKAAGDYKTTLLLLNNENSSATLEYTDRYDVAEAGEIERKLLAGLGDKLTFVKVQKISAEGDREADIKLTIYDTFTGETVAEKFFKTENINEPVK